MNIALSTRLVVLALVATLLCAATVQTDTQPFAGLTIVVDPGHGGNDWGVDPAGSDLREKDVNPLIAQQLVRMLKAEGARVLVTRERDQFVSLNARVRFSNAILFRPDNSATHGRLVSIHLNSNRKSPGLRRVEVLVDPEAAGPFAFAEDLAARLRVVTDGSVGYLDDGYPPGVHPADVAPVRWTYPRGLNVLTEAAFISNPTQAEQLKDAAFIEAIARAHVEALRQELVR